MIGKSQRIKIVLYAQSFALPGLQRFQLFFILIFGGLVMPIIFEVTYASGRQNRYGVFLSPLVSLSGHALVYHVFERSDSLQRFFQQYSQAHVMSGPPP